MGRTLNGIAGTTALILLLAGCRPESDRYGGMKFLRNYLAFFEDNGNAR